VHTGRAVTTAGGKTVHSKAAAPAQPGRCAERSCAPGDRLRAAGGDRRDGAQLRSGGACLEGAGRRHVPVAEDTIVRICGVGVGALAGARGSCDPRSCRTRARALTKAEIELFVL